MHYTVQRWLLLLFVFCYCSLVYIFSIRRNMLDKTGSQMLPVLSFLDRRNSFYEDITERKEHNAECKHLEKIHHANGVIELL